MMLYRPVSGPVTDGPSGKLPRFRRESRRCHASLRLSFDDCLSSDWRAFAQNHLSSVKLPGRVVVPTNQVLTPAGRLLTFPGRPTDLAMLEDQRTVVVKNLNSLIVLDAETGNDPPDACDSHRVVTRWRAWPWPTAVRRSIRPGPAARSSSHIVINAKEPYRWSAFLVAAALPVSAATLRRPVWPDHGRQVAARALRAG